ncbi:hypothetical protein DL768_010666 [Monosporascus sp. mg162]|nr:hypothetical protein DL768_010666 [Monosporascus sp. mg162]
MYLAEGNLPGDNNGPQIQIPAIVFFAVTPLFLTIRIWSRKQSRSGIGWDDWMIVISWVFAQIVSGLMLASCAYGFGQHIYNISTENKLMALKLFYTAQTFYKFTTNLTKSSILLLYLRIFVQSWFRITCYVLLGTILTYMVAATASSIWQCSPVARAWDKSLPGTCIDITANWYANAGFSIATDVVILTLPMFPIYQSQLPSPQRLALMVVFALGIFVTITSILRMQTLGFSSTSPDTTYDVASSVWTVIEQNVAVICACLPMCKCLLGRLFPSVFDRAASTSASSSSSWPAPRYPLDLDRQLGGGGESYVRSAAWTWIRDSNGEKFGSRMSPFVDARFIAASRQWERGYGVKYDEQASRAVIAIDLFKIYLHLRVDEEPSSEPLRNSMSPELIFEVLKRQEVDLGGSGGGRGALVPDDERAPLRFAQHQHPAPRVLDDDDLAGAQQLLADDHGPQRAETPAFRTTYASPSAMPKAEDGSMRASMQVTVRNAGGV